MEKIESKADECESAILSRLFASQRNTDEYWTRLRLDLDASCEVFGPPTFFVTLSVAEFAWEDVRAYVDRVSELRGEPPNCRLEDAPVEVAEQFNRRLQAVLRNVILKKKGPLGTVDEFFWRVEYQQASLAIVMV